VNVAPPSLDSAIQSFWPFLPKLAFSKYVPRTATSPFGKTTGTFPIVCLFVPVAKTTCGVEKLAPPSVERANIAGPVYVPTKGAPSGSSISRSQAT
jgi:hypothetical protein